MKNLHFLSWLFLIVLTACRGVEFPAEEEQEESSSVCKLTILTRSVSGNVTYPVAVYVFQGDGSYVTQQTLASSDESLALSLDTGTYRLVAVSGFSAWNVPENPRLTDVMTLKEASTLQTPLLMGQADVTIQQEKQSVNMLLSNQVAGVNVQLKDVPTSIQSVRVVISSPGSGIQMNGEVVNSAAATIDCVQEGDVWTTGQVYVLPTLQKQTIFTISLTGEDTTETYSYTYHGTLKANVPYSLTGSYVDGMNLTGSFTVQDWENTVGLTFHFGPGTADETGTEPIENENDSVVYTVEDISEVSTVFQGHVVASVTETSQGADLLLISLMEWTEVASALNTENPDLAATLAQQYTEGDLSGWRIPTKQEAQELKTLYGSTLDVLNNTLTSEGGTVLTQVDSKDKTVRYLCEDGNYTFAFTNGSVISKAGTKTTYRLRLVRTVQVVKE